MVTLEGAGIDSRVTANKIVGNVENAVIVDLTVSSDSPVRKKLRREGENVLINGVRIDRRAGIIRVLRTFF